MLSKGWQWILKIVHHIQEIPFSLHVNRTNHAALFSERSHLVVRNLSAPLAMRWAGPGGFASWCIDCDLYGVIRTECERIWKMFLFPAELNTGPLQSPSMLHKCFCCSMLFYCVRFCLISATSFSMSSFFFFGCLQVDDIMLL